MRQPLFRQTMSNGSTGANLAGTTTPRVAVLQRIVPHYRIPLFRALTTSDRYHYSILCGESVAGSSLASTLSDPEIRYVRVANHYFCDTETLVWQSGVVPLLWNRCFDVIIAEFSLRIISNVVACLIARSLGVPFIWWGHGLSPSPFSVRLTLAFARMADALLLYSYDMKKLFMQYGLDERKLFVALNSVDVRKISEVVFSLKQGGMVRYRILYIGRLIPAKKVDLLVRAFALAKKSLPTRVRLTVVGDGPCRDDLEALAGDLGIAEQVDFLGEIVDETVLAKVFAESWISVSPGYVGLAAIHSLAYGVPMVVASGEPHSPEVSALEEGVTAVFFNGGDVNHLAGVLVELWHDSERRTALARAGQTLVAQNYSIQAMVASFESAIESVLKKRGE